VLTVNTVEIPPRIEDEDIFRGLPGTDGVDPGIEGGDPDGIIGAPALLGEEEVRFKPTNPIRVGLLQKPRKLHEVVPDYPEPARLARIQGVVVIEAATDVYGRVATARVVSGNALLNEAALRAVRQWMYEPYVVGGVPHPVIFTVTVTFTLAATR